MNNKLTKKQVEQYIDAFLQVEEIWSTAKKVDGARLCKETIARTTAILKGLDADILTDYVFCIREF